MEHYEVSVGESPDPPFETTYKNLLQQKNNNNNNPEVVEECELPLIDLKQLDKKQIARASQEWGFFQVINHGIPRHVIDTMTQEQVKLFNKPFSYKKDLNLSAGSYRWGTPSATCLNQLSWSEAFHIHLTDILHPSSALNTTLSQYESGKPPKPIVIAATSKFKSIMEQYASKVSEVAQQLADILAEEISQNTAGFLKEKCVPSSCYLRLNRYPVCPINVEMMMGIMPHTDSDFLTVLHQDNVGGLQLVKDGMWVAVKPNPDALIINIGDLFQAWSNNVYKSVEHRVVANAVKERFSIAYFLCPSFDTVIESDTSSSEARVYRSFSFGEFKKQVQKDVQIFGHKVGLPRFLISNSSK